MRAAASSYSRLSPLFLHFSSHLMLPSLAPPGLVLLLAKLCMQLESGTVPELMEQLAASPLTASGGSGEGGRASAPGASDGRTGGARGDNQPPPFVAGEVARRFGSAADALLCTYVEAHGRGLSALVRRSVGGMNWLAAAEPRGPRPLADLLLARLVRVDAELVRLVESSGRSAGALGQGGGSGHHRKGGRMHMHGGV